MAEDKSDREYLGALAAQFNETDLSEIDFDRAAARLTAVAGHLEALERAEAEAALLRDDYQSRIAGMMKAIAAVDRSTDGVEAAAEEISTLPGLSAEQLVRTYRRTAVRFRDRFPTSYGPRLAAAGRTLPPAAVRHFK